MFRLLPAILLTCSALAVAQIGPGSVSKYRGQQKEECRQQQERLDEATRRAGLPPVAAQCQQDAMRRDYRQREREEAINSRRREWDEALAEQRLRNELLRKLPSTFTLNKDGRTYYCTNTGQRLDCR